MINEFNSWSHLNANSATHLKYCCYLEFDKI